MNHLLFAFIFVITEIVAIGQTVGNYPDCVTNPPDFALMSYEEANVAVMLEERKSICPAYITNLVKELREAHLSNEKQTMAIWLLGQFHPADRDSIEFLVENIDFTASRPDPAVRIARWGIYPAEEALMQIGKPVENSVLRHLPGETNELRRVLMCDVLIRLEGKKELYSEADGKRILQDQIDDLLAHESAQARKANLEAARHEVEHWDPQKLYRNYRPPQPKQ